MQTNKNGEPEAAVEGRCRGRTSTVELFGDPGYGDQRDGGGDDVELQVAQPCQILQMGIAYKVNRHKRDDDLVHGSLLLLTKLIGVCTDSVMDTFRK